jgi:hypothetical protein
LRGPEPLTLLRRFSLTHHSSIGRRSKAIDYAAQLLIHLLRRRFQLRIADHYHQRPNGSYKVYFHDLPDQGEAVTVVTRIRNIAKCWGKFQIKCAIVLTPLLSTLG